LLRLFNYFVSDVDEYVSLSLSSYKIKYICMVIY